MAKKYEKACDQICKHVKVGEIITVHDAVGYVSKSYQDSKSVKQYLRLDSRFKPVGEGKVGRMMVSYKLSRWKRVK